MAKKNKSNIKVKSIFDKDTEVLAKIKQFKNLHSSRRNIQNKIESNINNLNKITSELENQEELMNKINISSLHDLYKVENNKSINNATAVIENISNMRKEQYKNVEVLASVENKLQIAEIDIAIAKINCLLKTI